MRSIKQIVITIVLGAVLLVLAPPISDMVTHKHSPLTEAADFAAVLDGKTATALRKIYAYRDDIRRLGPAKAMLQNSRDFSDLFDNQGILIVVLRDDKPVFWTGNAISPVALKRTAVLGSEIHRFENGWYRLIYRTDGIDEYIGAILVQKTYPYDNAYLVNGFTADFAIPGLQSISLDAIPGSVKLKADHQTFYLQFDQDLSHHGLGVIAFLLFSIGGAVLILVALLSLTQRLSHRIGPIPALTGLAVVLAALRYWTIISGWPSFVGSHALFNPAVYGSSVLFPTFGDLILNTVLIAVFALMVRRLARPLTHNSKFYLATPILSAALLFAFGIWINTWVDGLIVDSTIPFDINNITSMTAFSFAGVVMVGIWYFVYYVLADTLAVRVKRAGIKAGPAFLTCLLIVVGLIVVCDRVFGMADMVLVLWPAVVLLAALYLRYYLSPQRFRLSHGTLIIVLFGLVGAHSFLKFNTSKERNERKIVAQKASEDDDPVAELLYAETRTRIARDPNIRKLFEQNELHTRETLQDYVLSRYFTGYWSKYNIAMHPYLADSSAWGKLTNVRPPAFKEIREEISQFGQPSSIAQGLYYIRDSKDRTTYLAVLPLYYTLSGTPDGFFVFQLSTKLFPSQIGFPALLMDKSTAKAENLGDYASAKYVDGVLTMHRGDYPYQRFPGVFGRYPKNHGFLDFRGYDHYVSKDSDGTVVVVSKPMNTPLDKATTFSYLCVIFALLYVFTMTWRTLREHRGRLPVNLNQKIQVLLVALTLMTMVLFTVATRYYIERKYTEKNEKLMGEKMQSILLELKSKLGEEEQLNYDMSDYVNRLLSNFSYIFFTDINIYNPQGNLLGSSQMRMFNENLVSRRIDPEAYIHVDFLGEVEYVGQESIGRMEYLSAYAPFYNENGVLLAYVNLPYFARQTELEHEISSFMVAVINLFVLVFLFSILFGLFISQWITSPLRAIRKSLAAIELGKSNRVVGYSARDEIGLLVDEYNAKVSELEHNAEKLAKSERESAWREMAKQVAHEIKNPLTPMKLSVQHLLRSVDKDGKVTQERLESLTTNLIEQIDTLSSIANAFSNFARMPHANARLFDLASTLRSALVLFEDFDRLDLRLDIGLDRPAHVFADRNQISRVFVNLIKNAIQSVPDTRRGKVEVTLVEEDGEYVGSVTDNGSGITDEVRNKMFMPSFTTKSRGMGLGLAICKSIVEHAGGSISFTSEVGSGSTFTVRLPKVDGPDSTDSVDTSKVV